MRVALAAVLLLVLAGCADDSGPSTSGATSAPTTATTSPTGGPTGTRTAQVPLSATAQGIVDASTEFAVDLLRESTRDEPGQNVFTSPFSVYSALAMAQQGARGGTETAMREVLRVPEADDLGEEYRRLVARLLAPRDGMDLAVGNSAWIDADFAPEVDEGFLAALGRDFGAEAETLDFASPGAVDAVNAWAAGQTRGKIPEVLESISSDEVMFLVNAVYFRGGWASPFNETLTRDVAFTRSDGSTVQVPMMHAPAMPNATYYGGPDFSGVRIPYADHSMAFYVVLPPEGTELRAFLDRLDGGSLDAMLGQMTNRGADVAIPRLDLVTHLDLKPTLSRMGMEVAFTDRADFSGIAPGLLITRVLHDAILEVDERGSTAAGVTVVGIGPTSLPPQIVADRPFLAAIRDEGTGTILFLGAIEDPTAS